MAEHARFLHLLELPDTVRTQILRLVPLDTRMRLAEVSHAWHRMVSSDSSLWFALDLSDVACASDGLLRAAAARSLRNTREIDLTGCVGETAVSHAAVCAVARASPRLRTLRMSMGPFAGRPLGPRCPSTLKVRPIWLEPLPEPEPSLGYQSAAKLRELLQAAPAVQELVADVSVTSAADARSVLLNEPPFGALRVRRLELLCTAAPPAGWPAAAAGLVGDMRAHAATGAPVEHLALHFVCPGPDDAPLVLDVLADAAPALGLRGLALRFCYLGHATLDEVAASARLTAAAVCRLLLPGGGGAPLRELQLDACALPLGGAELVELCDALARSSLERLQLLEGMSPRRYRSGAVVVRQTAAVVAAVRGHPTLRHLALAGRVRWSETCTTTLLDNEPPTVLGAALAALLAADTPALRELDLAGLGLYHADAAQLFAALPGNTHLLALDCAGCGVMWSRRDRRGTGGFQADFVQDVVTPALRDNASLRWLRLSDAAADISVPETIASHAVVTRLHQLVRMRALALPINCAEFVFQQAHAGLCAAGAEESPLAQALARNASLVHVVLGCAAAEAAEAVLRKLDCARLDLPRLLDALVAHPSLRELTLRGDFSACAAAVGAALGRLVAAHSPALRILRLPRCSLGDAGLTPLFQALRDNPHLEILDASRNGVSDDCARDVVLPCVRANASLRSLSAATEQRYVPELDRAMRHVEARNEPPL